MPTETTELSMLVLKRSKGEEILINEEIRIVVTQTSNGSCSLAIEAPDCYRIRRAELQEFQESVIQKTASAWQVEQ
jgi:carbon storage regulator CsrA